MQFYPIKLAKLCDKGVKNSVDVIAKSLEGNYREEHVFTLTQEYELYQLYQEKIAVCDKKIQDHYKKLEELGDPDKKLKKTKKKSKNKHDPDFDLQKHLYVISGVDFTQIDGLQVVSVQNILSETGLDHKKWPSEKHFSSWLGLCPNNKITGGKIKNSQTKKVINRATLAFRQAAASLHRSNSALGDYYRRMKSRLGAQKAVTATAHKLACMFYRMMKYGHEYIDPGVDSYEKRYRSKVIANIRKRAKQFGLIVPEEAVLSH